MGSNTAIKINLRVVAATHRNLEDMVREGRFGEDQRRDDIALLANHFLGLTARRIGKAAPTLHQDALAVLADYTWPGNVRELENAVEHAVLLAPTDVILANDLPPSIRRKPTSDNTGAATSRLVRLDDLERTHILKTLEEQAWNQARAAEVLGIGRNTLWRKFKDYGVQVADRRPDTL